LTGTHIIAWVVTLLLILAPLYGNDAIGTWPEDDIPNQWE
jgi:hypothetical protein